MRPLSVDDIKMIELDIMDEIDRVCMAHGIEYFLAYGSLLGAVRHGGFIPWDDDMDLVMLRDQYEMLMEHFNEWRSSERFKLVSYRDGSSIYQFAKIVDTTTVVYENFVGKKAATGVWVDIFPLEYFDSSKAASLLRRYSWVSLLRSFAVADPSVGSSSFIKLVKHIVCPVAKKKDPYRLAKQLDEIAIKVNESCSGSGYVINVTDGGDASKIHPRDRFAPVRLSFEGRKYCAPADFEDYLETEYGDWQTPPPEHERLVHVMEAYQL